MALARVVLDANVIVSALIRPDSIPGRILAAAIDESIQLIVSEPLLVELRAVLAYPRLRKYLKIGTTEIDTFIIMLEQVADPVSLRDVATTPFCRDPKDEIYIQTAVAGRADFIVTGDSDLLILREVNSILIVAPAEFNARHV